MLFAPSPQLLIPSSGIVASWSRILIIGGERDCHWLSLFPLTANRLNFSRFGQVVGAIAQVKNLGKLAKAILCVKQREM